MPFPGLAALLLLSTPIDLYTETPYDASVPRPETILGHLPGEGTITTYYDQVRTLEAIAAKAPARMKMWSYGKSVEGRPLHVMAFSSPKNMARLEEIRKEHDRLGHGDKVDTVPIVWINECIHGNEPASFESAMLLAYTLAAANSPRIKSLLDNAVVIVNPVYNPDGHERFAVYYDSIARGDDDRGSFEKQEPSLIHGRENHYRFDMNRDRVSLSQDETVQEVREVLRWKPQVYVDQHGQVDTYFFPPNPMSVNANVDRKRLGYWTDLFGRATGKAFDSHGWTYFVKNEFDLYYAGYLDSFNTLLGAIGMTHETDGGKYLAQRRDDDSVLTLRDGMEKHFTSALAVAEASAQNRAKLLEDYRNFRAKSVSGESAGRFKRVVLTGSGADLERLRQQLAKAGIVAYYADRNWTQADAHDYWSTEDKTTNHGFPSGSLVVDIAQEQGALAKSLLEAESAFEPEFFKAQRNKRKTAPEGEDYPGPEGTEFYDLTGWALPYAHNLKAWWCESAPDVPAMKMASSAKPTVTGDLSSNAPAYAIRYEDSSSILAVADLLNAGVRGRVLAHDTKVDGRDYPAGTFIFLAARNEGDWRKAFGTIAAQRGVRAENLGTSYPDEGHQGPGSEDTLALHKPKIAVVFGNGSNWADAGSVWYLMDRVWHLPFTAISSARLSGDLSEFTCIVLPDGAIASASGKLKEWVSAGGNLVVLGNVGWAIGSSGFVDLKKVEGDPESLPGSLFRAKLDRRSWLTYGYDRDEIAVPIAGDAFYTKRKEGGSIVTLGGEKKLLTGWEFEGTEKALENTVWLQDVPVGRGHAVLFMQDPTDRALWPGLEKMLLNAMLLR
ncbi:M14 family zinc carboxypeptidase [soil metagenome]